MIIKKKLQIESFDMNFSVRKQQVEVPRRSSYKQNAYTEQNAFSVTLKNTKTGVEEVLYKDVSVDIMTLFLMQIEFSKHEYTYIGGLENTELEYLVTD